MKIAALCLAVLVLLAGSYWLLAKKTGAPSNQDYSTNTSAVPSTEGREKPSVTDNVTAMSATLHTTKGDITIEFFADKAPNTVANFRKLAEEGFYDGTKFHRVIENFMNQGGDPLTKDDSQAARWGTGGPGYRFADEIYAGNRNDVGTISMANAGPDTNGSQFFINVRDNASLDTKHTVFGRVTAGLDVVMAINSVETDARDRPLEPVVIKSITLR
jgi:cyclophilin family peptidyl-prolyl cis-trans isomerase